MTHQLHQSGLMAYPSDWWRKLFFKLPLYLWRLGFGWALNRHFLVLTTYGRKTTLPRHTMVEFVEIAGRFYVLSGWGERTHWYKNIVDNPLVTAQPVRGRAFAAQAVRVNDNDELAEVFAAMRVSPAWGPYIQSLGIEDTVEDFVAHKERVVLLRLDPVTVDGPEPLRADYWWVTVLLTGALLLLFRRRS
ncbi:MAG: nitroreductase family deazaflavin-dependent oxidoreductase [Chloroflexota bacterium]